MDISATAVSVDDTRTVVFAAAFVVCSYNSAVFASTSSNNYGVFSVDHAFLELSSANSSNYADVAYLLRSGIDTSRLPIPITTMVDIAGQLREEAHRGMLVNLTKDECIREYTKSFQSSYRNVLLVGDINDGIDLDVFGEFYGGTVDNNASNLVSFLYARFYSDFNCAGSQAFDWTCIANGTALKPKTGCDPTCDDPRILQQTLSNSTWNPLGPNVQYCLAEPTQEQCSLQFSMGIAILVVILNFVKLTAMALTVLYAFDKEDLPLLTMGDAVASFLEKPDGMSKGMCLISASKIKELGTTLWHRQAHAQVVQYPGEIRSRWSRAVSTRRWLTCLLLYVVALSTAAGYLGTGLNAMVGSTSLSSLWSIGFGVPSGRTLIQSDAVQAGKASLIAAVVLANIPQLVLSMLYFTYNGLFTCMLLASEWNSYSTERKGLRISSSHPQGAQRAGYFLQLPYRYSIPLVVFSLLFHWLISQSIFVVNISMFDFAGSPITNAPNYVGHLVTCGYSPIAIIFSIVLGVALVCALLGFGLGIRFKTGMPIAGSCSLAIAAACHSEQAPLSDKEKMLAQQPLMWGEMQGYHKNQVELGFQEPTKPLPPAPHLPSPYRDERLDVKSRLRGLEAEHETLLSGDLRRTGDSTPLPPETPTSHHAKSMQAMTVAVASSATTAQAGSLLSSDETAVAHCSFSDGPVEMPTQGRSYA
ncbi:hypothetical protein H2200_006805 [Cladophialophora chaetospira]|uniref:Uncharacterized protein n=1 Tax=Cladophialophora chaetospira TaxID=386627 RepID=A0AA38X931_9EURO|nr:hypothetical protein H2200_006805 [Cladophialophora chaetospira]